MKVAIVFTQNVCKMQLFVKESSWSNSRKTVFILEDKTDAYQSQYGNWSGIHINIPGRKERIPRNNRPYTWELSPSMWPVAIKYDRKRRELPRRRRNNARAIDFHGILLKDFGVYVNRRSTLSSSLSSVGRTE
jgi:hypothetical protein